MLNKKVNILGIRGIPAAHGGFETFAGHLAPYLTERGWKVNVYCQLDPDADGVLKPKFEDNWNGINRIHIGSTSPGSLGSIKFDWRCVQDASKRPGVNLILGYNTAVFSLLLRLRGRKILMNMDGVEWKRAKWALPIKAWFYLNEFAGAHLANVPIADHPEIARHLRRHGCMGAEVIPYGAERLEGVSEAPLTLLGLTPHRYYISIARIEPENSILELVSAFSSRERSNELVVLGRLDETNPYHAAVRKAASTKVRFVGAIYDKEAVSALRTYCLAYLHGHQVGGTNPSLVEALGAGNLVIAHDNKFNRWVAGPEQHYFSDVASLDSLFTRSEAGLLSVLTSRQAARLRHEEAFTLAEVNKQYERLLERYVQ